MNKIKQLQIEYKTYKQTTHTHKQFSDYSLVPYTWLRFQWGMFTIFIQYCFEILIGTRDDS